MNWVFDRAMYQMQRVYGGTQEMKTEHNKAVAVKACGCEWIVEVDWDLEGYLAAHIYLDQGHRDDAEDNGPDLYALLTTSATTEIQDAAVEAAKVEDRESR